MSLKGTRKLINHGAFSRLLMENLIIFGDRQFKFGVRRTLVSFYLSGFIFIYVCVVQFKLLLNIYVLC